MEGTSPQVDNVTAGGRPRKIWRQFREVKRFFARFASKLSLAKRAGVFAREASKLSLAKRAGGRVEVAREASGVCEGKKKNRDKP